MKLVGTLIACLLLALTTAPATAQEPILDTAGQPLLRGVEYYIKPAANATATTNPGGPFTLVDRNGSCPFYVGQENSTTNTTSSSAAGPTWGIPVTFSPYVETETAVRESRSFTVAFSAANATCPDQPTTWAVGDNDTLAGARLVGTTGGNATMLNYFHVYKGPEVALNGSYGLRWCPAELCPYCRFNCGFIDVFHENGKRLLVLNDTSAFPVVFERADLV